MSILPESGSREFPDIYLKARAGIHLQTYSGFLASQIRKETVECKLSRICGGINLSRRSFGHKYPIVIKEDAIISYEKNSSAISSLLHGGAAGIQAPDMPPKMQFSKQFI